MSDVATLSSDKLKVVPLSQIRQSKVALRDVNRQGESFLELAQSIRTQGVISAISLRRVPGEDGKEYQLVDGLQRFTASNEVGTGMVEMIPDQSNPGRTLPRGVYVEVPGPDGKPVQVGVIPAQIVERSDAETMMMQIIGNAHRVETRLQEYCTTLVKYLAYNPTLTLSELAVRLGKSPTWVEKNMTLTKLNEALNPLVNEGKISAINAYNLVKLPPDEQMHWAERAMTQTADVFGPACLARVKAIRDAHNKGKSAGPEQFEPQRHIRKKGEIDAESMSPAVGPALVRELDITKDLGKNAQGLQHAAVLGFALGVNWTLSFDPKSQAIQKEKWDAKKAADDDAKKRRALERTQKQEEEALKAAETAQAAARKAAEEAKNLPPAPAPKEKTPLNPIAQAELDAQKAGEKLEPVA